MTYVEFLPCMNIATAKKAANLAGYRVTKTLSFQNGLMLDGVVDRAIAENDIATAGYLFC
jgi:hypothetical protein